MDGFVRAYVTTTVYDCAVNVVTLVLVGDAMYSPQSLLIAQGGAFIVVGEAVATGGGVVVVDVANCECVAVSRLGIVH